MILSFRKKILYFVTLLAILLPSVSQAQSEFVAPGIAALQGALAGATVLSVPTQEASHAAKEVQMSIMGITIPIGMDTIAITVVKHLIENLVDSTVDWINNGFNGNPAYATNPKKYFATIADGIAGQFIEGSDLAYLCSPFQLQVKMALLKSYTQPRQFQCTFTGALGNLEAFYEDFNQGGWDAWFSMTQNNANNPYGAYVDAKIELDSRIATAVGINEQQLGWNSGFISWSECDALTVPGSISESGLEECTDAEGRRVERRVVTPGKVVEGQLQNVLNTNLEQLELADEFDEMIGALIGQLLEKTVFGIKGLFSEHDSFTSSSDGGSGPSFPSGPSYPGGDTGGGTGGDTGSTPPTDGYF